VVDAGSRNGIFVNGKKVQEHPLKVADEIEIGEFVLLFDPPDDSPQPTSRAGASVLENLADPLTEEVVDRELQLSHERLRLAMETLHLLHSLDDERVAMKILLERVLAEISASRGFVMLLDERGKPVPAAKSAPEGLDEFHLSSVLYHPVSRERRSVIGKDVVKEGPWAGSSVSCLCVPLVAGNRYWGFLYLDGKSESTHFARADLRFAAIVAGIGAVAVSSLHRGARPLEPVWKGRFSLPDLLARFEREAIHKALRRTAGDRTQAAALLGLSATAFEAALAKHGAPPAESPEWKSVEPQEP